LNFLNFPQKISPKNFFKNLVVFVLVFVFALCRVLCMGAALCGELNQPL